MTSNNSVSLVEIADEGAWNDILAGLPTYHAYTTWSWGKYKQRGGWSVRRIGVRCGTVAELAGCLQLQKKRFGPVTVLLVQGGIHLRESSDSLYHEVLNTFLRESVASRPLTVAIVNQHSGWSQDAELGLLRSGFSPLLNTTMYTYVLDRDSGALSGRNLSGNWRHNLKRAQKNADLTCRWLTGRAERASAVQRMELFYAGLRNRKSFAASVNFELARDILIEDERFRIVEALLSDQVIATRIAVVCNDHVLDFLAASADAARNTYANYLLLWEMIKLADTTGKAYFDCGGVQPAASMGVFNFKKGLGGRLALNGPLWLAGSGLLVRTAARMLLSRNP